MTTTAASFLTDYTEGFAQLIAARVDPALAVTWRVGSYTAGELGIYLARVPTTPDRVITLTPIPTGAGSVLSGADVLLQTRYRAGPDVRDVWAIRDAVRAALTGAFPIRLPTGVYVSTLEFAYGGSLGMDDNQRFEWADNWRTTASDR